MIKSLSGAIHLVEADLIDILKQHFARFQRGFKRIHFSIDQAERDKPRFEVGILLEPLNKPRQRPKVESVYSELLAIAEETTAVEHTIMGRIYEMVKNGELEFDEFNELVNRIKGC